MLRIKTFAAASLLVLTACGTPIGEPVGGGPFGDEPLLPLPSQASADQIDLTVHISDAWSVEAVAIFQGSIFTLMPGRGILKTDAVGDFQDVIPFDAEGGFPDLGYSDLDLLPDGRIVLAAPNEAVVYDPETQVLEPYFCLEPGWGQVVMENSALTVDAASGGVFGAPTYYDTAVSFDTPSSAFHVSYGTGGTFQAQTDVLASGIVAEGMVFDAETNCLFVVDGSRLAVFDEQGALLDQRTLDGIEDASGLARDGEGRFLVSDRADLEVRAFTISDF